MCVWVQGARENGGCGEGSGGAGGAGIKAQGSVRTASRSLADFGAVSGVRIHIYVLCLSPNFELLSGIKTRHPTCSKSPFHYFACSQDREKTRKKAADTATRQAAAAAEAAADAATRAQLAAMQQQSKQ